jgi:NADH-quinone oxidoreductase subunit H
MRFGWKFLIPISLVWILAVATVRAVTLDSSINRNQLIVWAVALVLLLLAASFVWDALSSRRREEVEDGAPAPFDPFAGGYPVPPLPGQTLPQAAHTVAAAAVRSGGTGSGGTDEVAAGAGEEDDDA